MQNNMFRGNVSHLNAASACKLKAGDADNNCFVSFQKTQQKIKFCCRQRVLLKDHVVRVEVVILIVHQQ